MNKINVAIVDDNYNELSALKDSCDFSDCFNNVDTFLYPKEFIEKLKEGNRYDLYLLDIDMPHIGGEDLLKITRKTHNNSTVAFISGANKHSTIALKNDVLCLSKPVDICDLELLIEKLNKEKNINTNKAHIKLKNVHYKKNKYIECKIERKDILIVSAFDLINKTSNKNSIYLYLKDKEEGFELKNTSLIKFEENYSLLSDKQDFFKVSNKTIVNKRGITALYRKDELCIDFNNNEIHIFISNSELYSFNKWYN